MEILQVRGISQNRPWIGNFKIYFKICNFSCNFLLLGCKSAAQPHEPMIFCCHHCFAVIIVSRKNRNKKMPLYCRRQVRPPYQCDVLLHLPPNPPLLDCHKSLKFANNCAAYGAEKLFSLVFAKFNDV